MLSLLPRVSIGYREGWRRGRVLLASFGPGLVVYFGARPGWGFVVFSAMAERWGLMEKVEFRPRCALWGYSLACFLSLFVFRFRLF